MDRRTVIGSMLGASLALPSLGRAASITESELRYLNGHCAAFDSKRGLSLVFGGADERQVLGELVVYGKNGWHILTRSGPPPRTFSALSHDSHRDRLVLFGGNRVLFGTGGDTILGDHWEWDGASWMQFGGSLPPARTEASITYDPVRRRTFLFGGWRFDDGKRVRLGDLWEWDGNRWALLDDEGPEPRSGGAMTFDSGRNRVVLAGGNGPRGDCWTFGSAGWSRLADLPDKRFNPCLAHHAPSGNLILFGGWNGAERLSDTRLSNGSEWSSIRGTEPPARNHSVLVPSANQQLMLIGGHTGDFVLADIWKWDGEWSLVIDAPPRARVPNDH